MIVIHLHTLFEDLNVSETILGATLGTEPQVVTLAVDALLADGIPLSRVIVVHTLPDREPIQSSLAQLRHEFVSAQYYGDRLLFYPHLLAGLSGPLADITTATEIDDAFRSLYTLLRQFKQAGCKVHLSIAGGRKTMTLFAMAAAQILFGPEDEVWHVVSSPSLLHSKKLHAAPADEVRLVPVPLVHWESFQPDNGSRAREFLDIVLTPAEREVAVLLAREGLSNAALASQLGKSPKTIANQLYSIYAKMGEFFNLPSPPDRATLLVLLGKSS